MDTAYTRLLPLAGTYNVRDLGGYPAGQGRTRWRSLLRADSLHRLDGENVERLVGEGVRTVIDLRQPSELAAQPNPLASHPAIAYHNVSLFDRVTPPVPAPEAPVDVLLEMYKLALAERGDALRSIFAAIAEAGDGVVLFHCTAGKDRTGIVAALLLSLVDVDDETITGDYHMTASLIAPMIEELIAGAIERGADVDAFRPLLVAEATTMTAFLDHLESSHGGVEAYLRSIGIDDDLQLKLKQRLLEADAMQ